MFFDTLTGIECTGVDDIRRNLYADRDKNY